MRTKMVPSRWLRREGRRLDVGPYLSGALEAKVRLEELTARKDRLGSLTMGGDEGIYHAGREGRTWVQDPEYGVPFLGSTDILKADLSGLPLISKKQVAKNPRFTIHQGWTLITRSGTIGRMAFARSDMDGMACSEHVMRVVPDPEKVPPGYLYAYLSSKFGVPQIISGTYGAIIQHIEPHHIAGLPVPRLGKKLEARVDALIQEAATLRANASRTLSEVASAFDYVISDVALGHPSPRISIVQASSIRARFDAQFHDPVVQHIRRCISEHPHASIGDWCDTIALPGIFKRIHIDDPSFGAPYYTGATLFWLEPQAKGILSKKTKLFDDVLMTQGTVLVQAFGQDGGLTGRSVWVGDHLDGSTTTHMLVRLRSESLADTAYLFGFLQSNSAYRQIACLTYGGSIPHFDEAGIATVLMPLLTNRTQIGEQVLDAVSGRDRALSAERRARQLIERAIEETS